MSASKRQKKVEPVATSDYTPKNILITGGAGFIASHVVIQLVKKYPQVRAQGALGADSAAHALPVLSPNFHRFSYALPLTTSVAFTRSPRFPQYKIVNFDKLDYCSSLHNLNEIKDAPNYKFIKGNILSADLLKYVFETEKIDTIIHAAAQTHVDNSFGNSFQFTRAAASDGGPRS